MVTVYSYVVTVIDLLITYCSISVSTGVSIVSTIFTEVAVSILLHGQADMMSAIRNSADGDIHTKKIVESLKKQTCLLANRV